VGIFFPVWSDSARIEEPWKGDPLIENNSTRRRVCPWDAAAKEGLKIG
jgi:hypothetical protein